jgi:hypothetical protein
MYCVWAFTKYTFVTWIATYNMVHLNEDRIVYFHNRLVDLNGSEWLWSDELNYPNYFCRSIMNHTIMQLLDNPHHIIDWISKFYRPPYTRMVKIYTTVWLNNWRNMGRRLSSKEHIWHSLWLWNLVDDQVCDMLGENPVHKIGHAVCWLLQNIHHVLQCTESGAYSEYEDWCGTDLPVWVQENKVQLLFRKLGSLGYVRYKNIRWHLILIQFNIPMNHATK